MKKIEINHELVDEKARIIGGLIDGMRLPEVFALIGTLIINIILSCDGGNTTAAELKGFVVSWLENLVDQINGLELEETEEESKLN